MLRQLVAGGDDDCLEEDAPPCLHGGGDDDYLEEDAPAALLRVVTTIAWRTMLRSSAAVVRTIALKDDAPRPWPRW